MGKATGIEWADATWNPWQGCTRVSEGCANCYMYRELVHWGKDPSEVRRSSDTTFYAPLAWKGPKRIFVCSWSDFFHPHAAPWREDAWNIMLEARQHTYIILTKRPQAMLHWWAKAKVYDDGPLPHIWAGVSVENQGNAWRLDYLAQAPAAVRFVSAEPLLGPLDLRKWLWPHHQGYPIGHLCSRCVSAPRVLNWVIAGGESGPQARPMHPDWPRSLRDQCEEAGVPFFFKQWGEWAPRAVIVASHPDYDPEGEVEMGRVGKKAAGALLDGVEYRALPLPMEAQA